MASPICFDFDFLTNCTSTGSFKEIIIKEACKELGFVYHPYHLDQSDVFIKNNVVYVLMGLKKIDLNFLGVVAYEFLASMKLDSNGLYNDDSEIIKVEMKVHSINSFDFPNTDVIGLAIANLIKNKQWNDETYNAFNATLNELARRKNGT